MSHSSVILTFLSAAFAFVEWENNPFSPVIRYMTCHPWKPVSAITTTGPPYFKSSPGIPQVPGALPFFNFPTARATSDSVSSALSIMVLMTAELSLYHNCDSTTIRLRHDYDAKIDMLIFFSRRIASNGSRRARYVVVVSITSVVVECVVVSSYPTYRSLVVLESHLWHRLRYD